MKRVWVRTDGYKQKKRTGAPLPENPYYYEEFWRDGSSTIIRNRTDSSYPYVISTVRESQIGSFMDCRCVPRIFTDFQVRDKLLEKMKSNQWNVPVFVAEAGKTMKMVTKTATSFARALFSLKRGDFVSALDHLGVPLLTPRAQKVQRRFNSNFHSDAAKAAGNAWLELKYGYTPAMLDVRNAMNTLMDTMEKPEPTRLTASSHATSVSQQEGYVQVEISPNLSVYQHMIVKESYRMSISYYMLPEDIPGRFGLLNPLEVVYELVPLSFVLDWFIPLGSYFKSFDESFRFSNQKGSIGYRQENVRLYSDWQTTSFHKASQPFGSVRALQVSRDPVSGNVGPSLVSIRPDLKINLSNLTSSIALLGQAFGSIRR
jgi:hypothetical protein